jgi:predicted  nucleic acid-binding Zn-ribbon protein
VVAEPAKEGGEKHVAEHEGASEEAQRRIGEAQIDLDQGEHCEEHLPIDVVKQVHRQKESQGVAAVGEGDRTGIHNFSTAWRILFTISAGSS